jgi:acyl-ACP thioesterase
MDHVNNAVYADWLDEQVMAAGGVADVRAIPRLVRLDYARAADSGSVVDAITWRDAEGGWSCRITDAAGTELLRARLERIPAEVDPEGPRTTS